MARRRAKAARPLWFRILKRLLLAGLLLGILGVLGIAGIFWYYSRDLPDIRSIDDYAPKQVTRVYSAEGELIDLWIDDEVIYRTVVGLDEIPRHMQMAMLAAEDSEFYGHSGLDFPGLLRAAYQNVRSGSFSQGASTITQQVVKNLILSPERTIRRKVQEVLLAFQLEGHLSKDEILTIYLNEVYFGGNRYGVEEASQYYFGRPAAEIDLAEAALLAGLVQSPARYNPYRHAEEAMARRRYVLDQMWEKGFVEESTYRQALGTPLALAPNAHPHLRCCQYFTGQVRRLLFAELGRERVLTGGLRVETTLRLDHQEAAQRAVRLALRAYDARHDVFEPRRQLEGDAIADFRRQSAPRGGLAAGEEVDAVVVGYGEGALVVGVGALDVAVPLTPYDRLNPEGEALEALYELGSVVRLVATNAVSAEAFTAEPDSASLRFPSSAQAGFVAIEPSTRQVLALVGGYDYSTSPFNRAVQARRQTGSAFKPFIYGAALAAHQVTAATLVRDEPTPFRLPGGRSWNPQNDDGEYLGRIPLRTALARSRNVVSVRLLDELGLERAGDFALAAGIQTPLTDNLTAALGSTEMPPLELVNGLTTIASGGYAHEPIFVTQVVDHRGQTVWRHDYEPGDPAIDPAVAYVLTSLMTSVIERGTGRAALALGRPAAGKTGTTNQARDAWFVGFVPQLVAGSWVGLDDNRPLGRNEYGGRAALPIWLDYMQSVLAEEPVLDFEPPDRGVVVRHIDPASGLLARPETEGAVDEVFVEGTAPTRYAPVAPRPTGDPIWVGPAPEQDHGYDDF